MVDLKATETDCRSCGCRPSCVLSAVEPEALATLAPRIQGIRFGKGETILHEGSPASGWGILCHGRARLTVGTEQGKRLLLRFCGPGELLSGSLSGYHGFSVTAASPCVVRFIHQGEVLALGCRYPALLFQVHQRLHATQRCLATRLVDVAYRSTRQRLVRVLMELAGEHGVEEDARVRIGLPLSLRDLAEMIGAARPTTSGELQTLARRGLVQLAWPTVFLTDPDGLRQRR